MTRWLAATLLLAALPAAAAPPPGHYAARLCVTAPQGASESAPNCGAAQVQLGRGGRATVQVNDVVYRLHLRSSQVEVVLTQGRTQIDAFDAPYTWDDGDGPTLRFSDDARQLRYEVRLEARQPAPKR